ncbi:MAG: methyltransferase family protein [Candidatus Levyibacteriota bacterium]
MNTLKQRTFTGATQFIIALGLFLFLPAWTVFFWQAWVYWFSFSIAIVLITLYFIKHDPKLIERRLNVGPGAEKEKNQKLIQTITSVLFILLLITPGIEHHFSKLTISPFFVWLGNLFVLVGFYIIFLVFKENSYTSSIIETDKSQKVITTGPYKRVRHPMYLGALVLFLATPFALGSYMAFIFVLLMIIMLGIRLLDEEKYLKKHLKGYTDYCHKTRYHLIPYIW